MTSPSNQGQTEKQQILTACRELILKWVQIHFQACLTAMEERLFQLAEKADNNDDQSRFYQACKELKNSKNAALQQYLKHVHSAFDRYQNKRNTAADYATEHLQDQLQDQQAQNLSLIDNNELEEKLTISAISRKLNADCSEHLYALNQRFSVLGNGHKITDVGNPVSPAVFAEGMQQVAHLLQIDERSKILMFKLFEAEYMSKVKKLYDVLNHTLKEKGVLPNLSHRIEKQASAQAPHPEELPDELKAQLNKASQANQINLFEAIVKLQRQLHPAAYRPAAVRHTTAPQQLIADIQQLQLKAGAILNALKTPQEVASSNFRQFQEQAKQETNDNQEVDTAAIEIVGLLFEYMLNDQQLPDSVKALLSYLHTPFLKIALQDKDFFEHPDHPARQLLNSLVAAGERWVEPFGKHKSDVFLQIKAIVEKLLNHYANDVRLFSELAFEFNHYLRQHSRRIRLAEKRAQQAAQGENKLKEIRLKVEGFLKKKVGKLPLAPPVRTLLFEPWANFLSFNLLRFGSKSEQWRQAAKTVDDIIWYYRSSNSNDAHSRNRAQALRQSLPKALQSGFETVGYDNTQAQHLLKALLQQPGMASTDQATPKPITADIDEVDISKQAEQAIRNDELLLTLKKTEFGTWFEFDADTKTPKRVKLAWSNTNTLHFMFVNRLGQQIAVKSGAELAAEIRSGKTSILSPLEDKPFFEKAMERVLEQLQHREQNVPNE